MAIDFSPLLPQISDVIARGASINVMVRALRLRQYQSVRSWLKQHAPTVYAQALENGKLNKATPAIKRPLK